MEFEKETGRRDLLFNVLSITQRLKLAVEMQPEALLSVF